MIGAISVVKKEDSQTSYKDDDYEYVDYNNQEFQDNLNMVNWEDCVG